MKKHSIDIPHAETFLEGRFQKSDIIDLLKGNQSSLCSAHFLH